MQTAVLSQICYFGERKMVMFQILLNGAEPCDTTQLSSLVCRSGGQQDPLGICVVFIMCPNKVSRRDWITHVWKMKTSGPLS